MATVGVNGLHSDSVTVLGPYYGESAEWSLSEYGRSRRGVFPTALLRLLQIVSPEGPDKQAAELRLQVVVIVVTGFVTVLAFCGVGCAHFARVAVTVPLTSWSSFCLTKRMFHYSSLALTTLRTEMVLEFFAKVNDDPNWRPSKHTGTERGVDKVGGMLCWKRTRNGTRLQI